MALEGVFVFLEKYRGSDPIDIDRTCISRRVQPSVHSNTASSTIFYLWGSENVLFISENPWILSIPRWRPNTETESVRVVILQSGMEHQGTPLAIVPNVLLGVFSNGHPDITAGCSSVALFPL